MAPIHSPEPGKGMGALEFMMRVKIDYDLCMGDRNCNKVCPEVFEYDEDQLVSKVLVDVVPESFEEKVRQAARECAPGAIIVEED